MTSVRWSAPTLDGNMPIIYFRDFPMQRISCRYFRLLRIVNVFDIAQSEGGKDRKSLNNFGKRSLGRKTLPSLLSHGTPTVVGIFHKMLVDSSRPLHITPETEEHFDRMNNRSLSSSETPSPPNGQTVHVSLGRNAKTAANNFIHSFTNKHKTTKRPASRESSVAKKARKSSPPIVAQSMTSSPAPVYGSPATIKRPYPASAVLSDRVAAILKRPPHRNPVIGAITPEVTVPESARPVTVPVSAKSTVSAPPIPSKPATVSVPAKPVTVPAQAKPVTVPASSKPVTVSAPSKPVTTSVQAKPVTVPVSTSALASEAERRYQNMVNAKPTLRTSSIPVASIPAKLPPTVPNSTTSRIIPATVTPGFVPVALSRPTVAPSTTVPSSSIALSRPTVAPTTTVSSTSTSTVPSTVTKVTNPVVQSTALYRNARHPKTPHLMDTQMRRFVHNVNTAGTSSETTTYRHVTSSPSKFTRHPVTAAQVSPMVRPQGTVLTPNTVALTKHSAAGVVTMTSGFVISRQAESEELSFNVPSNSSATKTVPIPASPKQCTPPPVLFREEPTPTMVPEEEKRVPTMVKPARTPNKSSPSRVEREITPVRRIPGRAILNDLVQMNLRSVKASLVGKYRSKIEYAKKPILRRRAKETTRVRFSM